MTEYVVQSGTLKIVLLAETALDAAIEAVQRWGRGTQVDLDDHRQGFEERIVVQQGRGRSRHYPTFHVLAYARGESPTSAWRRLLERNVCGVN
jgi:hypothetical protein